MKALSGLFQRMFGLSERTASRCSGRRRRLRGGGSLVLSQCEPLEAKRLMAVDAYASLANQTLSGSAATIDLANHFRETTAVVGTVVKFDTNAPLANADFYVELFDKAGAAPAEGRTTPITATNFLSYVSDGSYDGTTIHRSVTDFVVQGGGFTAPTVAADQSGSDPVAVSTKGTITNEPGNSNLRGTLAMAKIGGQPNSATSQWFVNLSDNTFLDTDNGGYAAFGEVLGEGMTVVDTLGSADTYDATTYYGNGALSDLPLWGLNADNIVLPQDFVTIETVSEVAARDLVSYSVASSAPGVVTLQLVDGTLRLTPVAGQSGQRTITLTARSVLEPSSVLTRTFTVTVDGQQAQPTVVENEGAVELTKDGTGAYFANGTAVRFLGGTHIKETTFPDFTLRAAETITGENLLLWSDSSGGVFSWALDSTWTYVSGAAFKGAPGTADLYAAETAFGVDADGDGTIGAPAVTTEVIEQSGSISLEASLANGDLFANGTAITYTGGAPLKKNSFAAFKLNPIQAETIGGKNILLFENTDTGRLFSWEMTQSWGLQSSSGPYGGALGTAGYAAAEVAFDLDLDGDTKIGSPAPTLTAIESRGTVILSSDENGNYHAGTALDQSSPVLFGGSKVDSNRFAPLGLTIQAAEVVDGQNMVLWKNSTGGVFSWIVDANWSFSAQGSYVGPEGSAAFYQAEVKFDHDANGDGVYGAPFTIIETAGQIEFGKDELGRLYADGNPIRLNGNQINESSFPGFTATAVDVSNDVTVLVWRINDGRVAKWKLNESFEYDGPGGSWQLGDDNIFEFEEEFEVDLDGDEIRGRPLDIAGQVRLVTQERGRLYAGVLAEAEWAYEQIKLNDGPLRDDSLSDFTPLAAEAVTLGGSQTNALLWRKANGGVWIWRMDVDWNYVAPAGNYDPGTAGFLDTEVLFSMDINGTGGIGG